MGAGRCGRGTTGRTGTLVGQRSGLGGDIRGDDEYEIRSAPDRLPGLVFVPVGDLKASKNRLHLDFRPDDQKAEVDRLLELGAHRVDVGQGEQRWVVLADPEGNEFCVLAPRRVTDAGTQFVESVP